MPMKMQTAVDLLVGNPPFGGGGFLLDALRDDDALSVLPSDSDVDPEPEPALSGMAWIEQEFERLQALPFAESSAGSEVDPPIAACDTHLAVRLRHQPSHLHAVTGSHLPDRGFITVTIVRELHALGGEWRLPVST
jgi:hypothetical protein